MNTETNHAATFYSAIENDTEVLEKNVTDYPSSSLTRFLLLYHYKKNNDPRYEEFAQQTAIYLYNPLWIQFHLSNADENGNIYSNGALYTNPVNGTTAAIENPEVSNGINIEQKQPDLPINEPINEIVNLGHSDIEGAALPLTTEKPNPQIEKTVTLGHSLDENQHDEVVEIREEPKENNLDNNKPKDIGKEPVKFVSQELQPPVNEPIRETLTLGVDLNQHKDEKVLEDHMDEKSSSEEGDVLNSSNAPLNVTDDHLAEPPNENIVSNQENGPKEEKNLQIIIPEKKEIGDNDSDDAEIEFEPLHTVDYFASQGIKIPEEALENDTLGKQVKSFTAWLKSMKKLHPGQLPEQNEVIERIIQTSSEVSNQNAHVLTEAMAEVLLKQGKGEKAIEMYEKLSLLNPSKSAYFADKIESLKII
ncbi:MAG TPA: hypothetical protein VIJ57_04750 [Hanamia sp.]